ncbi:MmyB family transcriptional regulator [Streptomyces sp. 4N509B]|uniref:MmyB family transcriptional regulator n=1 Tax=Streptomyces sp. 4N509B TaxID=3457413 RepID=UPI003FD10F10
MTSGTGHRHAHPARPERDGLPALLRAWRARAGRQDGQRRPLTQVETATRARVSERWYRKVEAGEPIRSDPQALDRLAEVLFLSRDERVALYLHTAQLIPLPPPETGNHDRLSDLINQLPHPAFLTSETWDLLGYNDPMATWFPWVERPRANLIDWVLSPDARHQILAWDDHVGGFLAMLRLAHAARPENPRLRELLAHTLEDPACRRRWADHPEVTASRDDVTFDLRLPAHNGDTVTVLAHLLHPANQPTTRLAILTPTNGSGQSR